MSIHWAVTFELLANGRATGAPRMEKRGGLVCHQSCGVAAGAGGCVPGVSADRSRARIHFSCSDRFDLDYSFFGAARLR
ncbi:hypothetical protein EMIT0158MI4_120025 [Burkholderia ambifaria]